MIYDVMGAMELSKRGGGRARPPGAPWGGMLAYRSAGPAVPPYPLKAVIVAIAVSATALLGQDYTTDKPAPAPTITVPLTPEQKAALQAVDVRIAGVEALTAKV